MNWSLAYRIAMLRKKGRRGVLTCRLRVQSTKEPHRREVYIIDCIYGKNGSGLIVG